MSFKIYQGLEQIGELSQKITLNSLSALEYKGQGVPSEKSTQMLKGRSCMKMKSGSCLGVAIGLREQGLAEQQELSFEKKENSKLKLQ